MSVAVVIPTFGRPDLLRSLVPRLQAQSLKPARILFVDDTPGNDVEEAAKELGVSYLRNPGRPSLTRARNLGISSTTEPVIAFLDSDVQVPLDYLERMVALLSDPRAPTAVQGHVPNAWNQQGWKRIPLNLLLQPVNAGSRMRFRFPFRNSFPHKPRGVSESEWLSGSNMVFHRERLCDLRFDASLERYCLGEDVDMGLQLRHHGHTILLDAETVVHELNDEAGRLDNDDLALMRVINVRHILRKYAPRRAKGIALTYQDLGWLLQNEPTRFLSNLRRYIRHRRMVRGMRTPAEWNPLYSFWESTSNK
ncbi:MAG: glycosyltransferase family 2 protein [Thermoplasmatota archaeon]